MSSVFNITCNLMRQYEPWTADYRHQASQLKIRLTLMENSAYNHKIRLGNPSEISLGDSLQNL